jgi:regulator of protease activity HflC (stomatin/prohibitin superfamily)
MALAAQRDVHDFRLGEVARRIVESRVRVAPSIDWASTNTVQEQLSGLSTGSIREHASRWPAPVSDSIWTTYLLKVSGMVYFQMTGAKRAIREVEHYPFAIEQASQTGLRMVLGDVELDDSLSQREKLNARDATPSRGGRKKERRRPPDL